MTFIGGLKTLVYTVYNPWQLWEGKLKQLWDFTSPQQNKQDQQSKQQKFWGECGKSEPSRSYATYIKSVFF